MDPRIVLILLSALMTGKLFILKFQGTELVQDTSILAIYLTGILTTIVAWVVAERSKKHDRGIFFVTLVGSMAIIATVWIHQIAQRQSQPFPVSRNDGETQSEEAARFILHGKNPYGADYRQTSFSNFYQPPSQSGYAVAATHYAYPPLTALLFVPGIWLHDTFGVAIDQESLYMVLYLAFVTVLLFAVHSWERRTWIAIVLLNNPLIWSFPMAGYNDIIFIFFLALAAWSFGRGKWLISGLAYGLALASKQTAWLSLPFFGIILWRQWTAHHQRKNIMTWLWSTGLTVVVLYLPFFLWSPAAMYNDLITYVGGAIPGSFPIADITLLQYLYTYGFVRSPWAQLPSWPFQLGALVPAVWWLGHRLLTNANIGRALTMTGLVMIIAALFTRFGSEHYYLAALLVGFSGWAFSATEKTNV